MVKTGVALTLDTYNGSGGPIEAIELTNTWYRGQSVS